MISLDVTKLTSPKLNDFLWISMVSKNIRAIRAHRELNEIVRILGIEIEIVIKIIIRVLQCILPYISSEVKSSS